VIDQRFRFVQWEFAGRLGPAPGRYPIRRYAGDDVREIVVVGGLEAPPRRPRAARGRSRRAPAGTDGGPDAVDVTRATVIDATPLYERDAAEAWLEDAAGDESRRIVGEALVLLNRAVAGHRIAAADPYVADADGARALVTRVGYGRGEEVADGAWEEARELAPLPDRVSRALAPQERLAAILSGRDVALACEELALRARLDLDQVREREAAMQTHLALEAAIAELESWRDHADMARRLDQLAEYRVAAAAAANAALEGGLELDAVRAIEVTLSRIEAALRARAAAAT
jgi:hypothetical protein